ncbi:MAG: WhiB family transcriptional regulator [Acidimicrobiia bacterium]
MTLTWVRETEWDASNWRTAAICKDSNAELFFPIGSTGHALDMIDAAKVVCESCPVSEPCLQFALDTNQEAGVWGGYTEEERRAIRRERSIVAS